MSTRTKQTPVALLRAVMEDPNSTAEDLGPVADLWEEHDYAVVAEEMRADAAKLSNCDNWWLEQLVGVRRSPLSVDIRQFHAEMRAALESE